MEKQNGMTQSQGQGYWAAPGKEPDREPREHKAQGPFSVLLRLLGKASGENCRGPRYLGTYAEQLLCCRMDPGPDDTETMTNYTAGTMQTKAVVSVITGTKLLCSSFLLYGQARLCRGCPHAPWLRQPGPRRAWGGISSFSKPRY